MAASDNLYLSNYATIQLRDELARLDGVGDITYIGQRNYSMRIWLDPQKMAFRNLTASDVVNAIEQQNIQVAAGQIGQPPVPTGQVFQYTITHPGPADRCRPVRRHDPQDRHPGRRRPAARRGDASSWAPRATTRTARSTASRRSRCRSISCPAPTRWKPPSSSRTRWRSSSSAFPTGVDYAIVYDTTPFITESINEVFKTLRDAIILVAIVVLVFLQNWRSALIPLIAVPVAIIGTFAVMAAMGFCLNNLTLFGLVLAIGIVVDDAIVVVEAVEHHIEHGLSPREATIKAMDQVSGAGHRRGPGAHGGVRALCVHHRHHRPVLPPVRA